ncbi:MAG: AMP-binding protein [Rhizobiales bacterium]|nr:AMP-binding protein [Hyphomicrobiales bacterium]
MNIVDNVLFQAIVQPKAPALAAPGTGIGLVSYGRLAQIMRNIAHRLSRSGIGSGTIVAVSIEDPIFETAVLLALTRMGAVCISGFDEQVRNIVRLDAVVTDRELPPTGSEKIVGVDLYWTHGEQETWPPECSSQIHPDDLCRITLTSGTTGRPKAVALSHALLSARIARHISVFGPQVMQNVRMFSDLPVGTSLGFQFLIFTLWRGGLFVFPGKSFDDTIDAFHDFGVGCCLSSPGGLEVLLKWFERYPALQSEIDVIMSAGDMLPKPLVDRVRSRICPHLVNVYSSTEASITATAPAHLVEEVPGAVGLVNPGSVVEAVDESDAVLPAGTEGLLRVTSPFAVDRYFEDPAASAAVFRDGWFYPGEIGSVEADGVLRLTGRNDTLLNLGGDKISPEAIEAVIAAFPGVTECAVFASANEFGNKEVVAVLVAREMMDEAKLKAHCSAHLALPFVPAKFIRAVHLPRNPMGKVDRRRLPSLLEAGSRTVA